jgi:hypothetical protein
MEKGKKMQIEVGCPKGLFDELVPKLLPFR